jgi:hypothetical protein
MNAIAVALLCVAMQPLTGQRPNAPATSRRSRASPSFTRTDFDDLQVSPQNHHLG